VEPSMHRNHTRPETGSRHTVVQHTVADKLLANSFEYLRRHIDKSVLHKDPVACFKEECSSEAYCFTDYQPRVSKDTLTARIVDSTLAYKWDLHPVGQIVGWVQLKSNETSANWTNEISFFDAAAVKKAEHNRLGYLDRKNIFVSHGVGSQISFFVRVTSDKSPIWLCECQKGFLKYPSTMTDLDKGALVVLQPFPLQGECFYHS
jgi:hypothetical protein